MHACEALAARRLLGAISFGIYLAAAATISMERLFSFARSKKEQVGSLLKGFPDREILRFQYAVIQLNLLDWRRYVPFGMRNRYEPRLGWVLEMPMAPRGPLVLPPVSLKGLYDLAAVHVCNDTHCGVASSTGRLWFSFLLKTT